MTLDVDRPWSNCTTRRIVVARAPLGAGHATGSRDHKESLIDPNNDNDDDNE